MGLEAAIGYLAAGLLRLWLLGSPLSSSYLVQRVELSTPLNSWKRLTEGVTLWRSGVDPYSGALFHETPLTLTAFTFLINNLSKSVWLDVLFVLADLLAAFLLGKLAKQVRRRIINEQGTFSPIVFEKFL